MPVPTMPAAAATAPTRGSGIAQSPPPIPPTAEPRALGGASLALRVAALFAILAGATLGVLLPVLGTRTGTHALPRAVLDVARYFGSGVIIGTAFIHLLAPAGEALASPCLARGWRDYPYALALCLPASSRSSRWRSSPCAPQPPRAKGRCDVELHAPHISDDVEGSGMVGARIVGLAILDFGAVLHSVLIRPTLAAAQKFNARRGSMRRTLSPPPALTVTKETPGTVHRAITLDTAKEKRILGIEFKTVAESTRDILVDFVARGWN
ncbi:hypothetical protein DFH09DRAFT_1305575 [Mycena vulgaris]|nr:hypothetical protein DFH09DRAFT_1305575 [Mycena vulgaris]